MTKKPLDIADSKKQEMVDCFDPSERLRSDEIENVRTVIVLLWLLVSVCSWWKLNVSSLIDFNIHQMLKGGFSWTNFDLKEGRELANCCSSVRFMVHPKLIHIAYAVLSVLIYNTRLHLEDPPKSLALCLAWMIYRCNIPFCSIHSRVPSGSQSTHHDEIKPWYFNGSTPCGGLIHECVWVTVLETAMLRYEIRL